ncbi:MarR family winged helix-turn-helix transcriptional regulator [Moraxella lacunata]|uniref:MarR family transcriptional regulator n=1 Tax=Moraxella lacunata TaxID=477 RepID=A0A1V4H0S6_MORLA|nr:helix-turn-helix domain-containing protein [Moraxella lacunata]OPH38310.1 MarR family transcriptional regulator [Moraxella lacunata]
MNSFDHFGQTASHLYGLYETWAKSKGINYATLAVLHTLVKQGVCTQKEIWQTWTLPKQTVSATCQKLHKDGLLAFDSTADGREKLMELTEHGCAFAMPIINELDDMESRAVMAFGARRADKLAGKMQAFVGELERVMSGQI